MAGGDLLERKPEALVPVVRDILSDAKRISTREVFESSYKLHALRHSVEATWRTVDALLLPTTPTIYRVDEVLANPRALNSNLGVYTTFGNLMDLAAIAVPFRHARRRPAIGRAARRPARERRHARRRRRGVSPEGRRHAGGDGASARAAASARRPDASSARPLRGMPSSSSART